MNSKDYKEAMRRSGLLKTNSNFGSYKLQLPSNEFDVTNDFDRALPYGLQGQNVSFARLDRIRDWLANTFSSSAYELEGKFDQHIWFAEEKHRTLLLLKWNRNS